MTGRTRTITRVAVVAILALVLGIVGLGATAPTADATGPGQSDHCPPGTTQVRFERAGTKAGFTVTVVSGKVWEWTYTGDRTIQDIWVFGGNALKRVPEPYGTSGTIDATALELLNPGGKIADISHVDFCLGCTTTTTTEPPTTTTTEPPTTTTTEPPTTTTTEPPTTTTTEPPTTTTTEPPTTTTTEPPTTTTTEPPTTTTTEPPPEVGGEVVEQTTTTAEVGAGGEALPRTGGDTTLAVVAAGLLTLGGALVAVARRRVLTG